VVETFSSRLLYCSVACSPMRVLCALFFEESGSLSWVVCWAGFCYGSLAYFTTRLEIETVKRVLTGVVAASGFFHFIRRIHRKVRDRLDAREPWSSRRKHVRSVT